MKGAQTMDDKFENVEEVNIKQADTRQETDRKCPACGGTMDFDPKTGGLSCPYCGHEEEIALNGIALTDAAEEQIFEGAKLLESCDWGVEKKTVVCNSCGAESLYDALETADICPYCGSNQVMEANDITTLAPNGVVPFKITAKQAGENFKIWIKRKWFCPKEAKESAKPENFKGAYLPFWTFDADTMSTYTAQYGKNRTVRDSKGNTTTVTDWHPTSGTYMEKIDDQLVEGSTRHEVSTMHDIEPFDTNNSKPYKPEYIAGFVSERYSVGLKDAWEKAKNYIKERLTSAVSDKIMNEKNADKVRGVNLVTQYKSITYKYVLLPIWISAFNYKQKVYQFMVNGETGKVGGASPISWIKVALVVVACIALIAVITYFGQ